MKHFLILLSCCFALAAFAETPDAKAPAASDAKSAGAQSDDGEYEIDYEEEPDTEAPEVEAPVPAKGRKSKKKSILSIGGVQGSVAKNRFVPILKSETKSVYKKDGNALDVDPD